MTDGVLTAEARQLIEKWREKANERLNLGGGRYKHSERTIATLRTCADDLEALLSRWRSAHGSQHGRLPVTSEDFTELEQQVAAVAHGSRCTCEIDSHNFNCPAHGSEQEGPT